MATTSVILDKRIQKNDGTYAVKLRITHNREQRYYPLNSHLTVEDWERTQAKNPKKEAKELSLHFESIEHKAAAIIRNMAQFSFVNFEQLYNQNIVKTEDLLVLLQNSQLRLERENRLRTSEIFSWTQTSLEKFYTDGRTKKLLLSDVTPALLQEYENWMLKQGRSISTVGIYLRNVRTVINEAIETGLMTRSAYPFGKRKYQIPSFRNVKRALPITSVRDIMNYPVKNVFEERARDLWLFTYLCNGINMKDIAKLRYKSISSDIITFIRSKSERSIKKDLKPVVVVLCDELNRIIDKWGNQSKSPNDFVFGILTGNETSKVEVSRIKQFTKTVNKHTKRIGINLGIDVKLTTYVARHTFATVLKRSGASIEFISESLGHKDLKTTENYLGSFEFSMKKSFQKKLLDFE